MTHSLSKISKEGAVDAYRITQIEKMKRINVEDIHYNCIMFKILCRKSIMKILKMNWQRKQNKKLRLLMIVIFKVNAENSQNRKFWIN